MKAFDASIHSSISKSLLWTAHYEGNPVQLRHTFSQLKDILVTTQYIYNGCMNYFFIFSCFSNLPFPSNKISQRNVLIYIIYGVLLEMVKEGRFFKKFRDNYYLPIYEKNCALPRLYSGWKNIYRRKMCFNGTKNFKKRKNKSTKNMNFRFCIKIFNTAINYILGEKCVFVLLKRQKLKKNISWYISTKHIFRNLLF